MAEAPEALRRRQSAGPKWVNPLSSQSELLAAAIHMSSRMTSYRSKQELYTLCASLDRRRLTTSRSDGVAQHAREQCRKPGRDRPEVAHRRQRPRGARDLLGVEMFPNVEARKQLGQDLQVSPRQIQVWFQNRRQRERKRKEKGARNGGVVSPSHSRAV